MNTCQIPSQSQNLAGDIVPGRRLSARRVSPVVTVSQLESRDDTLILLELFSQIACEQGWQPGTYLSSIPANSIHFALHSGGEIIGGVQVVLPDAEGKLGCHAIWPEADTPAASAHITILALKKEFRGNIELFWILGACLFSFAADNRIKTLVLEATPGMVGIYRKMGLPLEIVGTGKMHWGEICHLTAFSVAEAAGTVFIKARRSAIFARFVLSSLQGNAQHGIVEETQTHERIVA